MHERVGAGRTRRRRAAVRERLSYANVAATLALFAALGGGSAAVAALSGSEKRVVVKIAKKQANKRITARAPSLSVRQADSADVAERAASADELACSAPVAGTGQMVEAGAACIDRYEASVWTQPNGGTRLATEAQIDAACPDDGQPDGAADCQDFYARSVPGVEPARGITYLQAQQALANSGRRLPTNAEWQQAVSGTPDSTACNVDAAAVASTGAHPGCVSRFGAFDMVGNVWEWVADWDEQAGGCAAWPAGFGSDITCLGNDPPNRLPGALIRGGHFGDGAGAGPLATSGLNQPTSANGLIGFRGAR